MKKFKNGIEEQKYFSLTILRVLSQKELLKEAEVVTLSELLNDRVVFSEKLTKRIGGRKLSKLHSEFVNAFVLDVICDEEEKTEIENFINNSFEMKGTNFEVFLKTEESVTYTNKKVLVRVENDKVEISVL